MFISKKNLKRLVFKMINEGNDNDDKFHTVHAGEIEGEDGRMYGVAAQQMMPPDSRPPPAEPVKKKVRYNIASGSAFEKFYDFNEIMRAGGAQNIQDRNVHLDAFENLLRKIQEIKADNLGENYLEMHGAYGLKMIDAHLSRYFSPEVVVKLKNLLDEKING